MTSSRRVGNSFDFQAHPVCVVLVEGIGVYSAIRPVRKVVDGIDSVVFDTGERIMVREVERVVQESEDELQFKDNGRTVRIFPMTLKAYKRHIEPALLVQPDQSFKSDEELVAYALAVSSQEVLL